MEVMAHYPEGNVDILDNNQKEICIKLSVKSRIVFKVCVLPIKSKIYCKQQNSF